MRHRSTQPSGLITRVNVTPIVDVALVLVIILLVTAPILSVADLGINLPEARTRDAEDERNMSISISPDGIIAVDDEVVSSKMLPFVLRARLAAPGSDQILVIVRADSSAPHRLVRQLLEDARLAGAKRLAIATRQKVRGDR